MVTWPERLVVVIALLAALAVIAWLSGQLLLERERRRHLFADVLNLQAELGAQRRINALLGLTPRYSLPGISARVLGAEGEESGIDAYNRLLVEELSKTLGPEWKVEISGGAPGFADTQSPYSDDTQLEIWHRGGSHLG